MPSLRPFLACIAAMVIATTPASAASDLRASAQTRPALSLDGAWQFRFAPDDRGDAGRWFAPETPFDARLVVPGCWEAQGIGAETDKMRHHAVGVGWYRRTFTLPPEWRGRQVRLVVGGAHRTARAWLNGKPSLRAGAQTAGDHTGYPLSFSFDLTPLLAPDGPQALTLAVDSRRHPERDPLTGAFDLIDYMDVDWGGIFGSVRLEATGDTWFEDAFVQPDPQRRRAKVAVTLGTAGEGKAPASLSYAVRRWVPGKGATGPALASGSRTVTPSPQPPALELALPGAPLWTPDTPNLLALELTLKRGGTLLDRTETRFGLRRLEARGPDFFLNGERFFLRGYGDDWTFPREVAGPTDVAGWRRYLLRRKQFGFNGVRHHSTMPPDAYLEAADEVGLFVQPELPIAYEPFFQRSTPEGKDLYRQVWAGYIRQMRNHPSVFAWCMGNELWNGFPLGPELYRAAKELDPTRPVIDSDGVPPTASRPTLDYLSVQFNEGSIPWGRSIGKYRLAQPARQPLLVHEMSNLSVLPDPADIPLYDGPVRPTWLDRMAAQVKARHLEARLPEMLRASRELQASLLKLNIEAARLSPDTDGYYQWLFRDYWHQSTGFVNQFDAARELTPEKALRFNGPAALLWERDRASFRAGEQMPLRLYVSDFRPRSGPALPATVTCILQGSAPTAIPQQSAICHLQAAIAPGARGLLGPWVGTIQAPAVAAPTQRWLRASAGTVGNEWPVWIFPPAPEEPPDAVTITRRLSPQVLAKLEAGASVFLTGDDGTFPTLTARFKPAWWHGDDTGDHTFGNLLLSHPALAGFPHFGYGDLQMAAMMDERPVVLLDDVPGGIEPIAWCLDVPWQMRRKAYLFEARVGAGRLLVSTLDLSLSLRQRDPAAAWLYGRLCAYAAGPEFRPAAELPAAWLREHLSASDLPDAATWVEGFARVVEASAEPQPWYSVRADDTPTYAVRLTDGKQRLRWQTAPAPAPKEKTVSFAWAGGIGWQTEPAGGHWSLAIDGAPALEFTFTDRSAAWKSADGSVVLRYAVRRRVGPDTLGLFLLTVPAERVRAGRPLEIEVTGTAQDSKRWFALQPLTDVAKEEQ